MTDRRPSPMPAPPKEPTRIDHVRNDADAIRRLDDIPFLLYAASQGARLTWSLIVKRYPELDTRKRAA